MKMHPVDPKVRKFWKVFPLRIPGGSDCEDCGEETVLVQSMKGGFVTRNCSKCNKPTTLPNAVFWKLNLWIACPKCRGRMAHRILGKNFGYACKDCDIGIPLFELLPRWADLQVQPRRRRSIKRSP